MEFWSMCRCKYISISWAKVEFPVSLISSATILRNLTNSEMAGGIISQKKPTIMEVEFVLEKFYRRIYHIS